MQFVIYKNTVNLHMHIFFIQDIKDSINSQDLLISWLVSSWIVRKGVVKNFTGFFMRKFLSSTNWTLANFVFISFMFQFGAVECNLNSFIVFQPAAFPTLYCTFKSLTSIVFKKNFRYGRKSRNYLGCRTFYFDNSGNIFINLLRAVYTWIK